MRRRSCANTRNTYRIWNRTVGATKKSTDTMLFMIVEERAPGLRWRLSMSHHVLGDGGLSDLDAEFQQLAVNARCAPAWVVATHHPNQIPNLVRYPASTWLARWIFHVQNKRNPLLCQATTVSALTISSADFQSAQTSRSHTQKTRSADISFGRLGTERRNTPSCCRSARFSSRNCADVLNIEASIVSAATRCCCNDQRNR